MRRIVQLLTLRRRAQASDKDIVDATLTELVVFLLFVFLFLMGAFVLTRSYVLPIEKPTVGTDDRKFAVIPCIPAADAISPKALFLVAITDDGFAVAAIAGEHEEQVRSWPGLGELVGAGYEEVRHHDSQFRRLAQRAIRARPEEKGGCLFFVRFENRTPYLDIFLDREDILNDYFSTVPWTALEAARNALRARWLTHDKR